MITGDPRGAMVPPMRDARDLVTTMDTGMQPNGTSRRPHREIHLKDLWAVVLRHWKLVGLLTGLVAGGAYFSGRRAIPRYQSQLTVQVASAKQVFARSDDIDVDELALRTDPVLSEALVLTTQALALRVVDALVLQVEVDDPAVRRGDVFQSLEVDSLAPRARYELIRRAPQAGWVLRDGAGLVVDSGGYDQPARAPGFRAQVVPADGDAIAFRIVRPEEAAAWVSAGLGYRVRPSTNAVDVSFTSTDPSLVPLVLNQAAVELRRDGAERARRSAAHRSTYVAEQLRVAEQASQQKLSELQRYKERERITDLSAEEQAIVLSIREFEQERQRIRVQIATLGEVLASTDSFGIETLNRLAAVEGTAYNTALAFQLNSLLELYDQRRSLTAGALGLRENNPQVEAIDQRIGQGHLALRGAVVAALENLQGHEGAIQRKIGELRNQLMAFPGKETRIAQLQLESSILTDTYRYLLGQFQQARMQEATISPYVTILDGASPPVRIGTSLRQKIVLGLLVGLLLGLGGAFFLEYLDQTIKTSADIERVVGTPVLGLIPHAPHLVSATNGQGGTVVVISRLEPDDPAVEAFRALRTNVTFVGAEKPLQLVAVTSPGPGEGKSTTAANLALALSHGGSRVLLIDGDLRRPQQHRAFGLVQSPGLTDVLISGATAREAVRPDVQERLDVLPAGPTPPNPSELLGSDAMHRLLGELRRDYDYIVIDTPPALPVTDATVVATIADATIMVIRSGETEEAAAQRAVDQLRRVRARIAGAVLNGVSARHDHYYPYYSYRREHRGRRGRGGRGLRARIAGML